MTYLGFESFANPFAVAPTTQLLIRQVVNVFGQQVDGSISKDNLCPTLVPRLEALARLPIGVVAAIARTPMASITDTTNRVVDRSTGTGPEGIKVHPAVLVVIAFRGNDLSHGYYLAGAIGDVTEASSPVATREDAGQLARARVAPQVTASTTEYVSRVIVTPVASRGDAIGTDRGSVAGNRPGSFRIGKRGMGIDVCRRTNKRGNDLRSPLNTCYRVRLKPKTIGGVGTGYRRAFKIEIVEDRVQFHMGQ